MSSTLYGAPDPETRECPQAPRRRDAHSEPVRQLPDRARPPSGRPAASQQDAVAIRPLRDSSLSRSNADDLETRVANRKQELITEIIEFKKSSRVDAAEVIERLKARLSDLAYLMREGVVDGWANVDERSRVKLDAWIAR
jgi:hypothetical protein